MTLVPRVIELMRAADAGDMLLVVGGVFPDEDVPGMKSLGVAEVFPQDAPPTHIINAIKNLVAARQHS
jgi:methylmalonyl-CoA mutase C-terminal domain/subunit